MNQSTEAIVLTDIMRLNNEITTLRLEVDQAHERIEELTNRVKLLTECELVHRQSFKDLNALAQTLDKA